MSKLSQRNGSIRFFGTLLTWMGISLAISLAISFILPFPWSLAVIIGIFLLLDFYLIRKANRRMRNGHSESSVIDSLSSLFRSDYDDDNRAANGGLKYYCISCGVRHKQVSCPKCSSKLKKIGSQ
jgi:hypothetical protein